MRAELWRVGDADSSNSLVSIVMRYVRLHVVAAPTWGTADLVDVELQNPVFGLCVPAFADGLYRNAADMNQKLSSQTVRHGDIVGRQLQVPECEEVVGCEPAESLVAHSCCSQSSTYIWYNCIMFMMIRPATAYCPGWLCPRIHGCRITISAAVLVATSEMK